MAAAPRITRLSFAQVAGASCSPSMLTLPVTTGDPGHGSVRSAPVTINFGSCATTARFTVSVDVSANGGSYTRAVTIWN